MLLIAVGWLRLHCGAGDKTRQMTHDARQQAEKLEKRGHALFEG
jgi:hypothetical protein